MEWEPCKVWFDKERGLIIIECKTISTEIPINCPYITYYGFPKTTDGSMVR